jgi:hypothetical protein
MGLAASLLLWDMRKFFDSIKLSAVVKSCLELEYPPVLLAISLRVHAAARQLIVPTTAGQCYSEAILPQEHSILAGCVQSVAWTRALMHDLLSHLHAAYKPIVIESWVDDLSQMVVGTPSQVGNKTFRAGCELRDGMLAKGCSVSTKSTLPCSTSALGKSIVNNFAKKGIKLTYSQAARDLGIVERQAKKLFVTGALPQFTWGFQANGLSPTAVQTLRATMANASGVRRSGGCCTTALALHFGPEQDPAFKLREELFAMWFSLWSDLKAHRMIIAKIWPAKLAKLDCPSRWQKVTGHIDAVIATALDIGWRPIQPLEWEDRGGDLWAFSPADPGLRTQLRHHLLQDLRGFIWQKAAKHLHGGGLENGLDLTTVKKHYRLLTRQGKVREAGILNTVAQGAMWDGQRKHQAFSPDQPAPRCRRCRLGRNATWCHDVWECPCTLEMTHEHITATNHLAATAKQGVELYPCHWLRGLVPWDWTWGALLEKALLGEFQYYGGRLAPGVRLQLPVNAVAATDGSGGPDTRDPRLRRAGWGLAVGSQDCAIPIGWLFGALPGVQQTVPRAELYALVQLALHTDGHVAVAVDATYVCKGFRRGPRYRHDSHQDLWDMLWQAIDARQGRLFSVLGPLAL